MRNILVILCLFTLNLRAQDLSKARSTIDTLCSKTMFGRGYANDGHLKAAEYIQNRFGELGLKSFDSTYLQEFPLTVNTYPENPVLSLDDKELQVGKEYIIEPLSQSLNGTFKVQTLPIKSLNSNDDLKSFLRKNRSDKALFVDLRPLNKNQRNLVSKLKYAYAGFPLVVFADSLKLTAGIRRESSDVTVFTLKVSDDFKIPSKISVNLKNELKKIKTNNIVAYIEGKVHPDSFIVFSGHYDHIGGWGEEVYFPGANDNASGTTMLLELADSLSKVDSLKYSIIFMAFGGEEAGLVGSRYYASKPLFPIENIKILFNVDMVGTGIDGIKMVNATKNMDVYEKFLHINEKQNLLKYIGKRGPAANSDHHYFDAKGAPAVFIYTLGGISAYHDVYDIPKTLPLTAFLSIKKLFLSYVFSL